ncbi:hypothetical protein C2S51_029350 [Perilla frutescens var. frutescens]|nr:hypothetical protein C2S51_029350 [Perilla frutescens var. frutescens]
MAEAVIGSTIDVLLQNLLSFPVEEIGLIVNFKDDLEKLKESIGMIRDFLEDAEAKQVTDKAVKRWLMKLEAVAYDADYFFDELNYEVLRKKVETDNKMKKKVSSFFPIPASIAFRRRMAKKVKDIKKELKMINKEASDLGLQLRFAGAHSRGAGIEAPSNMETDSFTMDRVFVGRENEVTKIVEMVKNIPTEKVVSVLPIVGMGGMGKTTLARKVYNHDTVTSHFENCIWVYVSEDFVPETVFKNVAASLTGENVDGSREVVLRRLQEKFENKRYLLVLDNVWNEDTEKWDNFVTSLEGISPANGNVIIVTTRSGNVASIVKTLGVHELGGLIDEDCWSIIKAKAFGAEAVPSEFEMVGKNIAKRCKGLPLAAKVVGGLLRGKSKDEWLSVEKKWLSDFGGDDGNSVSKILKLSYDNLSSPSVKKCFAYCSIIPKGAEIFKEYVIALWMAEGFLQSELAKDMEIVGNKVFNLLIQSSLLQVGRKDCYGNIIACRMHDLVHDLASSVLNPKFVDITNRVRYISVPSIYESSLLPKEHAKCLRALFYRGKISHIIFSNLKCLHTLILNGEHIKGLPMEIGKLISLRCLDISHTRIECLPDSTGDLYHLQTLTCGYKGYLRKLPDTLKYLVSLRHLNIPNIKLPPEIGKLDSLQTLRYFQVGDEEGCGIKELGSLKNLRGEVEIHNLEKVRAKEEAKSADLFHKPNIFKLKLVWNESGEGERSSNDENVLEGLQPHPNLKSLEINGFKGTNFPLWTLWMAVREGLDNHWVRLDNLLELNLSGCKECKEIPMLGHLPHLKWLYLQGLCNVKSMGSSFYGIDQDQNEGYKETVVVFPTLEKLELIGMANLTQWDEVELLSSSESQPREVSAFGRLEYLKITDCKKLKSAPSDFPFLKELEIDNMESGLALANICGSKLSSLTKLIIKKVDGLECLPDGLFYNNRDLLELEIWNCDNLTHLVPRLGGGGASLRKLEIRHCRNLKELPEDLHSLSVLVDLWIYNSPNLKSIPYYPSQLSSQGGFTSLRSLKIRDCTSVTNLPIQMLESCVSSLERLWLYGSESITNFSQVISILPQMPRLAVLSIMQVPKSSDMAAEIGSLQRLRTLGIGGSSDCWDYVSFKERLDHIFPTLQSLHRLVLYGKEQWDALPDQLQHLTTLQYLHLREFGIEALPEWLGNLSSLKVLRLIRCQKLRRLAPKKAMHGLTKLTQLIIVECPLLKQNLEEKEEASDDDSEWSKISHIPNIKLDGNLISPPAH